MTTDRLAYTPQEFAEATGLPLRTVQDRLKRGLLPGKKIGRLWLIPRRKAEMFLNGEIELREPEDGE